MIFVFQEANKRSSNWLPPPWAIAALFVLGFNEFITLLRFFFCIVFFYKVSISVHFDYLSTNLSPILFSRNPLYLVMIFISYLLLKALWVQLDIGAEFRHGFVSVNAKINKE